MESRTLKKQKTGPNLCKKEITVAFICTETSCYSKINCAFCDEEKSWGCGFQDNRTQPGKILCTNPEAQKALEEERSNIHRKWEAYYKCLRHDDKKFRQCPGFEQRYINHRDVCKFHTLLGTCTL